MGSLDFDKWGQDADAKDRTLDVAAKTLALRFSAVEHYLPLAADHADEDVEHVHQLRVWTRRASAALRLFECLLPRRRVGWLRDRLRKLRRAAGEARDLDVLAERFADGEKSSAVGYLEKKIAKQRDRVQRPIQRTHHRLKKAKFFARVAQSIDRLRRGDGNLMEIGHATFALWARNRLRLAARDFFSSAPGDKADFNEMHAFRIRGKQLRYTMELVSGAFPSALRESLYPKIELLQEKLGAINDLVNAKAWLKQRICRAGRKVRPELLSIRDELRRRLAAARQDFDAWWTPKESAELHRQFDAMLSNTGMSA